MNIFPVLIYFVVFVQFVMLLAMFYEAVVVAAVITVKMLLLLLLLLLMLLLGCVHFQLVPASRCHLGEEAARQQQTISHHMFQ